MGITQEGFDQFPVVTTTREAIVAWGRKNSMWPLPFGTACCAIEFMSTISSVFDLSRFGAELVRFSPRQSDLMIVAGTITHKMAPILKQIYDQMSDPKWVIAMGACTSTGGMYRSYSVVQGIDQFLPVDVYVAGCPPRPDNLLNALIHIQNKIGNTRAKDFQNAKRIDLNVIQNN